MNSTYHNKLRAIDIGAVAVIPMTASPDGVFAFAAGRGIPIKS